MISRYTLAPMSELFTDEARFDAWLEVEVLAVEAWAQLGKISPEDAQEIRSRRPKIDKDFTAKVAERERVTDHDVAAFVDVVQQEIGSPAAKWIHFGLTSSDVTDTALCFVLKNAGDILISACTELIAELKAKALEHRDTAMVGRTHGVHAEPTTFGTKVALWCLQSNRDLQRLRNARDGIAVGKLSGAVGTYSNIDPAVEAYVCEAMGLRAVPATQVISRDRHAEYLYACASVGASIDMIATEIRHLQRTEVREAEEAFGKGQKGSSAMPHKRNPIKAEQLCGLARLLRGYVPAAFENVALWHERDISHSSVERVALPDASQLTHYMLVKTATLIKNLKVNSERMRENLNLSYGLVFSQPVLLALIDGGLSRDDAYRVVQRNAMQAWEQATSFRSLLEADADVALSSEELDEAFSLPRALRNNSKVFDELEDIDV